jgi:hypothetical protein
MDKGPHVPKFQRSVSIKLIIGYFSKLLCAESAGAHLPQIDRQLACHGHDRFFACRSSSSWTIPQHSLPMVN